MSLAQSLGRMGLSLLVVGALCGACDDGGDDAGSTAEEQGQADAGAERAGAAAAGRGGSAARDNNNSAAGRGGRGGQAASGGSGNAGSGNAGNSGASAGAAGAVDPERTSLSDGQIVAILAAVNATEVSLGTLAVSRAVAPAVRNFGASMIAAHNAAQERQTRLAMSLDLTADENELSMQLAKDAESLTEELTAADAAEFDALYLRSQVDGHMKVLMLIGDRLMPSVQSEELRDELMLARMEVATHLEGARNASTALEDTDAGMP